MALSSLYFYFVLYISFLWQGYVFYSPLLIIVMNLMQDFRRDVIRILSKKVPRKDVEAVLEKPPERIGAELAFPCFNLAKKRKRNPAELANELSQKLKSSGLVREVNFYGPYINFYIDWLKAAEHLLKGILKEGNKYGRAKPLGRLVMVEYSAPNTNKPLHLGHLRNGAIGMALANILEASGYKVVKANLFNNRGSNISKSMLAYKLWGKKAKPSGKPDHFVGKFYVMFEKKRNEKLDQQIQEMLRLWESGDKETQALWKKMDDWSIKGFRETYKRFGSEFDVEFKESDFWNKADPIIKKGLRKGTFKKNKDGFLVANLEKYGLGKKVIRRADDTSIYITNDLALTPHKFKKFKLNRAIWVVGSEQNMYFKQLFKIFELLGFPWAKDCYHLSYGLVFLPEGKMKSREGRVVDADDIINEIQDLAKKEIKKREKSIGRNELEKRSLQIGLAALKYFMLKMDAGKDIHFKPEESLSFEGDTGPYIQYSHARAKSILRKAGTKGTGKFKPSSLGNDREIALLRQLADFPDAVQRATKDLKPHYITGYALDIATKFNEFYQVVPVLKANKVSRPARLALVSATALVLKNALNLLGIEAPDRM
jgi:arginyl-tRNA synthetase